MNSSRNKTPQSLGASLSEFLRSLGIEGRVHEYEVMGRWAEIVGENIADASEPIRVSDGVLLVKVRSSSWRNELVYMKDEILDKIEKMVAKGVIRDIKYI